MGSNIIILLYYLLTITCVIISSILSYFGFLSTFGAITILFVVVIALGLFGADALIQRARVSGSGIWMPLLLFFGFAIFSGASNFNALYSNFMKRDAVVAALGGQVQVFRDDLIATRQRLSGDPRMQRTAQLRVNLDRELQRLKDQVSDPMRPGCGPRCYQHLSAIEQLLGKPLTDLAVPQAGSSLDVISNWYLRVAASVENDFSAMVSSGNEGELSALIRIIDQAMEDFALSPTELSRTRGLNALQEMADISSNVERRANAVLNANPPIEHRRIDAGLGRLGELAYSFRNAFVDMPNPFATFISLILGLVVDLFPVAFALVAFSPNSGVIGPKARKRRGAGGIPMD